MKTIEKIFLDMDGVLADFNLGVSKLCGIESISQDALDRDPRADAAMWAKIREVEHFYDSLELMPGAKEMFDELYGKYGDRCEILTGIPRPQRGIQNAGEDKIKWVRRLLSEDIKINIVLRAEKPKYCTGKGCILIDDLKSNIRNWENAGGTGILHVNPEETMRLFRETDTLKDVANKRITGDAHDQM